MGRQLSPGETERAIDLVRQYCSQGKSDVRAAALIGVSRHVVRRLRQIHQISPGNPVVREENPRTVDTIRRLAGHGQTDTEISAVVGLSPGTVKNIRYRHKIRSGYLKGRRDGAEGPLEATEVERLRVLEPGSVRDRAPQRGFCPRGCGLPLPINHRGRLAVHNRAGQICPGSGDLPRNLDD